MYVFYGWYQIPTCGHRNNTKKSISGELRVEGGYRPMSATEERASQQQKMMEDELGEKSLEERLACTGMEKRKCT